MTFVLIEAELSFLMWQDVCLVGTKLSVEQRAYIKFCYKLQKSLP